MDFSPTQHVQLRCWLSNISPFRKEDKPAAPTPSTSLNNANAEQYAKDAAPLYTLGAERSASGQDRSSSAKSALNCVIALTVPPLFLLWRERYTVETTRTNLLSQLFSPIKTPLMENFTVSLANYNAGRYWTLLTSNFAHLYPQHYVANLTALITAGQTITDAPGITAMHVWTLTIGSGICSSIAFLAHQSTLPVWRQSRALGASGIATAFGAVAALLEPSKSVKINGVLPVKQWQFALGIAAIDAFLLNDSDNIGHAAHLGGAAFGVAYYFLVIRNRPRPPFPRRVVDGRIL
ncbi:hypothetical protein H2203_008790 [Taxawa tesnikishii (nom. ined.)]|nr:hypothetical protein H2203_008790 [Dothideales sp. JES 119]